MSEIFFLEHKNVEVRVEPLGKERVALELGTSRYILTPSECSHVAEMLNNIMRWDEEEREEEWSHEMTGEEPEYGWNADIYDHLN